MSGLSHAKSLQSFSPLLSNPLNFLTQSFHKQSLGSKSSSPISKSPLQDLEKGKKDPSKTQKATQGAAIHSGEALAHDGKLRSEYTQKAKELPRSAEGSMMRDQLKMETRAKLRPLGKGLSEMAADNKLRQSSRAAKNAGEIIESTGRTSQAWNKFGAVSETAGRGLLVLGAGMSVYNIATAPEGQKAKVVSEEAGSWAGALVGGEVGAEGGAAIGTMICPGLGTAVGAFVGGIGGGIVGAIGGSKLGGDIYNAVKFW